LLEVLGKTEDPRLPARVLSVRRCAVASGVLPPSPSRLPPGAGDKGDEPEPEELEPAEEGYEEALGDVDGHAATVGADGDGDEIARPARLAHRLGLLPWR
jgi:hypothetical protein